MSDDGRGFDSILERMADGETPARNDARDRARVLLEWVHEDEGARLHEISSPDDMRLLAAIALRGVPDAAAALGMSDRDARGILTRAEMEAAAHGWEPPGCPPGVPAGFARKFETVLTDADGKLRQKWSRNQREATGEAEECPPDFAVAKISQQTDGQGRLLSQWRQYRPEEADRWRLMMEAAEGLYEPLRGHADPVEPPDATRDDLLACYVMGDPHLGMYAWGEETGAESHDLERGERDLVTAMRWLVDDTCQRGAPATALLVNLGDFFHADNQDNETLRGKHKLDVDGRYGKVVTAGVRALRTMIDLALTRHERVVVENVPGNHDPHSAFWLAVGLQLCYERDPRVEVVTTPSIYRWHTFGSTLIGLGHSEHAKPRRLAEIMAARHPGWSNSEPQHRVFYRGHHHEAHVEEHMRVRVECFQTLAAPDAYAASSWDSGRSMAAIVHHRDHGEQWRHYCGISRVRHLQETKP